MNKTFFITTLFICVFLAGCDNRPPIASQPAADNQLAKTPEVAQQTEDGVLIPEVGVRLVMPEGYGIKRNENEPHRAGSVVSYDFTTESGYPGIQEVLFYSEDSMKQYADDCKKATAEDPEILGCFEGNYPDTSTYKVMKELLAQQKGDANYELKKINGRDYLVENAQCGHSCHTKTYSTFIGDMLTQFWVVREESTSTDGADELFEKFKIQEENKATTKKETTLTKIKDEGRFVYYAGTITLSGTYEERSPDEAFIGATLCFNVDDETGYLIPRDPNFYGPGKADERVPWFCFKDQEKAKQSFGIDDQKIFGDKTIDCIQGKATVSVSNYIVDRMESEVFDTADLDKIISIEKFSTKCD